MIENINFICGSCGEPLLAEVNTEGQLLIAPCFGCNAKSFPLIEEAWAIIGHALEKGN